MVVYVQWFETNLFKEGADASIKNPIEKYKQNLCSLISLNDFFELNHHKAVFTTYL